jgi:methionyl-tRNA formyltransferase
MKIVIVTQNEPFYLKENIAYLISNLPNQIIIDSFFILNHDPLVGHRKKGAKILNIINVFGMKFFLHYSLKFLKSFFKESLIQFLKQKKIQYYKIEDDINSKHHIQYMKTNKIDLIISILGNQIFKHEIIKAPKLGIINLHTSLLPKYRGVMPTFWVLKNNEKTTGVSVFFVDKGIDSGPIISQKTIQIDIKNQSLLIKKTKKIGMELIIESLNKILSNNYELIQNIDSDSTYYGFPSSEDVKLFLNTGAKFY